MNENSEKVAKTPRAKAKGPLKKRIIKAIIFLLYILIMAEIGSRIYWKVRRDVPFFSSQNDWYNRFYEELNESGVWEDGLERDNSTFDVLLLGGSALDRFHDSLAEKSTVLQDGLAKVTGRKVKVYNLASPGMTTRDSLTKYRLLADKHFDLVIVYHGVNDTRLNNCPPEMFEDDYTHSGWYHKIAVMQNQIAMLPYFSLPYTLEYSFIHVRASKKLRNYIPRHRIHPEWTEYGSDVKTAKPFGNNLQEIVDLAAKRDEPLLMMTFGWYIPQNYSLKACRAKKLDYADSPAPSVVELWGDIDGVKTGLAEHNKVVRKVAADNKQVFFVDAAILMPQKGEYFNDVCHLSEKGKKELYNITLTAVKDIMPKQPDKVSK